MSEFLTPFLELDEEFCKNHSLEAGGGSPSGWQHRGLRASGFQRRHSLCPVTLPNSRFNSSSSDLSWALGAAAAALPAWGREGRLPRSALSRIPFRVDRSVSMIEGGLGREERPPDGPPPGLCASAASLTSGSPKAAAPSPHISARYKTELCRTYEESGTCKYGSKCQFAHGMDELRGISRHPKYKTELCRTFHTIGFCPYGARCHFIHNAEELSGGDRAPARPPPLRHSLSFAGFSSSPQRFRPAAPTPLLLARASSVSPSPPSTGSPELLSPLLPEPGPLKHRPYLFSGLTDLAGEDLALHFCAVSDSAGCPSGDPPPQRRRRPPAGLSAPPGLQRCSSADSLSEEGYASSCSLSSSSSGAESPSLEGRRLPIFSRLSVTDE